MCDWKKTPLRVCFWWQLNIMTWLKPQKKFILHDIGPLNTFPFRSSMKKISGDINLVTFLMNTESKTGNRDGQTYTVKENQVFAYYIALQKKKRHFQHIFPSLLHPHYILGLSSWRQQVYLHIFTCWKWLFFSLFFQCNVTSRRHTHPP